MKNLGYVQTENLKQHQEQAVAYRVWAFLWPKPIISLAKPIWRALSLCSADPKISLSFLWLFILLQSLFTLGEMAHQSFSKPYTYMKADIILGAFIPFYIPPEGPSKKTDICISNEIYSNCYVNTHVIYKGDPATWQWVLIRAHVIPLSIINYICRKVKHSYKLSSFIMLLQTFALIFFIFPVR